MLDHHIKKLGTLITTGNGGCYELSEEGYAALAYVHVIERIRFTKLGFFIHLAGYYLGNLLIFPVWLKSSWGYCLSIPCFLFPLIGWGLGLLCYFYFAIIRHRSRTSKINLKRSKNH